MTNPTRTRGVALAYNAAHAAIVAYRRLYFDADLNICPVPPSELADALTWSTTGAAARRAERAVAAHFATVHAPTAGQQLPADDPRSRVMAALQAVEIALDCTASRPRTYVLDAAPYALDCARKALGPDSPEVKRISTEYADVLGWEG